MSLRLHVLLLVIVLCSFLFLFVLLTPTTLLYTLSLHDALPISDADSSATPASAPTEESHQRGTPVIAGSEGAREPGPSEIGRAVQQECRDRSRMPSSA